MCYRALSHKMNAKCSNCNAVITLPVEKVGETINCPSCRFAFVLSLQDLPSANQVPSPPSAQPTYLQASLDRVFDNFEVKPSNEKNEVRCIVELTYFENQMLNLKGFKGVARRALVREHRIYCNGQSNEITKTFEKLTSDALSQFAGRMAKTSETLFDYLVPREKKSAFFPRDKRKMFLPISALSIESKKRIYGLFSSIISEELAEINEIRNNLTYADKLVKPLNEMLHDLRRYFSIKDTSSNAEKIIILKAAASEARESYYKLKEELQNASPTKDTTRLENRLRKAQNEVATLASAIQTLEQTVLIESKK